MKIRSQMHLTEVQADHGDGGDPLFPTSPVMNEGSLCSETDSAVGDALRGRDLDVMSFEEPSYLPLHDLKQSSWDSSFLGVRLEGKKKISNTVFVTCRI